MNQIWIVVVAAVAVVILGVPLAAIVLVSIASRREEAAHSLSRLAPGPAARAARRLLGFRTEQMPRIPDWAASYTALGSREVRFGHARRPGSDARQFPASRQPQPRPVRADQRQGAGV